MKKVLVLLIIMFSFLSITDTQAQGIFKKKKTIELKNITAFPNGVVNLNGLIVNISDRTGQLKGIDIINMQLRASGDLSQDPEMTIIFDEELGVFRLAENTEEQSRPTDNVMVFRRKRSNIYKSLSEVFR